MSKDSIKWGRKGRMMQWLRVVLSVVFLAAILLGVNVLAQEHYVRKDMTTERSYAIDDFTQDMLRSLDRDVTIYLVPPGPQEAQDRALGPVWQKISILCGEFQKRSSRIRVKQITEADPTAMEELRQYFNVIITNSIYFLGETGGERYSIKALKVQRGKFYEGNPNTGEVLDFSGERWLVAGIQAVTLTRKRIVYSVIGHGEATADQGLRVLMKFLEERERIELRPIVLRDITRIPSDASCVLVPGPQGPFDVKEFDILEDYLERGGSLFLALYPRTKRGTDWLPRTGFGEFLEKYGVKHGLGFVCDQVENYVGNVRFIPARRFGPHPVNSGVQNLNTTLTMPYVSVVEKASTVPPYCTVSPLFFSAPTSWEEYGRREQVRPRPDGEERLAPDEGMPLAMAVSTQLNLKEFGAGRILGGTVGNLREELDLTGDQVIRLEKILERLSSDLKATDRSGIQNLVMVTRTSVLDLLDEEQQEKYSENLQGIRVDSRIVVWGSAQALGDPNLISMGYKNEAILEYILKTFRWLMEEDEEEQSSISSKRFRQRPMDLTPDVLRRIWWVTLFGFPGLALFVSILAWFLRRK